MSHTIKKFTKHEIAILAYELRANKMWPFKGLRVYFDEKANQNVIDFTNGDAQLRCSLISAYGEYDTKSLQKQLEGCFLGGEE